MKWTMLIAAAALAGAAGCMHMHETPAAEPADPAGATACGAENFGSYIGQTEAAFAAVTFPAGAMRVICHECAVTMDYREDRLNFWLDADGKIARVSCG